MSLAPDTTLSEDVRQALRDLVWSVPQNELLTYAATGEALMGGGFRKKNIGVVRARIMQVAEGREPIDDNLRRLLVRHDPCGSCLAVLSVEAVKENLAFLAALFGGPRLELGLLLDPRLASLASSCSAPPRCEAPPSCSAMTHREESPSLREALAPLLAPPGAGGDAPPPAFTPPAALKEARAEAARLKGADERLKKERELREKAEAEARKWRERAEKSEREAGPLRQRAEVAEAARDRCLRDAEAIAGARLEARMAEEFAEWLGDRRAAIVREFFERAAPAGETAHPDPLLAKAEDAISRQARADLAAGTRSALEARLSAYEEALSRCGALLSDALRPTDELVAVEKELAAETRRIRQLLHPGVESASSASPEEAIARAVNIAADHELPILRNTANRLAALGIVTDGAAERINERIRNRYAALYARRGGPGLDNGDAATPEDFLRAAIDGGLPLILLIDGHNALFALQSRYCRPQDHRGPSAEAREWLVNDVAQIVAESHNCRVVIVFDGPEYSKKAAAGNVTVVYSGGGGSEVEHRADDAIVAEARFLRDSGVGIRILLATNDNGLASRAAALGVGNVAPTALLSYMR